MIDLRSPLILASQSAARRSMLRTAGLSFECVPAPINEQTITADLLAKDTDPADIAIALAQAKALAISPDHPEALIIGSDQILEFEGALISKAKNRAEAKAKLRALSGKTHRLISAVSLAQKGRILWSKQAEATLHMRALDDDFLEIYCKKCEEAGSALTHCVGAYEIEGNGAWLFSKIEGEHFTIMGLPLLPLLGYLKTHHRREKS